MKQEGLRSAEPPKRSGILAAKWLRILPDSTRVDAAASSGLYVGTPCHRKHYSDMRRELSEKEDGMDVRDRGVRARRAWSQSAGSSPAMRRLSSAASSGYDSAYLANNAFHSASNAYRATTGENEAVGQETMRNGKEAGRERG